MKVTEIFSSIQGEGQYVGMLSTFVRLYGCSFGCTNCDTLVDKWEDMSASDIVKKVVLLHNRHVVITGGEPLESNIKDLIDLIYLLEFEDIFITVETSGIIYNKELAVVFTDGDINDNLLLSISPKLSCLSGKKEGLNMFTKSISQYLCILDNYRFQLKFVVDTIEDVEEVNRWLAEDLERHKDANIIFQPLAYEGSSTEQKLKQLYELYFTVKDVMSIGKHNVRVLPQYHKLLSIR